MSNPNSSQKNPTEEREWKASRERFKEGQLVEGIVVRHEPFGMLIDLGHPRFLALVELPSMERLPGQEREVVRPAVYLRSVNQQPRLIVRSFALRAAAAFQHAAKLPAEHRQAKFL